MSTIVLTGAAGFLGSRILRLLLASGHPVRPIALAGTPAGGETAWAEGDLRDARFCGQIVEGAHAIVHAAAEKNRTEAMRSVNVIATRNLLEAAVAGGVRRFIYISTVGVIGADPLWRGSFGEHSICAPRTEYERTKLEAELLVRTAQGNGLWVAILRPANIFGEESLERPLLALARAVRKGHLVYLGGPDAMINLAFVEDVAQACLQVLGGDGQSGVTYHVCESCRIEQLVAELQAPADFQKRIYSLPRPLLTLVRPGLRVLRAIPRLAQSSTLGRAAFLVNGVSFETDCLRVFEDLRCGVGWREGVRRTLVSYTAAGLL